MSNSSQGLNLNSWKAKAGMENNTNVLTNASVPSFSKTNERKYVSTISSAMTHPAVRTRNNDYLEAVFKKINSGNNDFSRIPTRIDPNVQFSDDEDEESEDIGIKVNKSREQENINDIPEQKENERPLTDKIAKTPGFFHLPCGLPSYNNLPSHSSVHDYDKKNSVVERKSNERKVNSNFIIKKGNDSVSSSDLSCLAKVRNSVFVKKNNDVSTSSDLSSVGTTLVDVNCTQLAEKNVKTREFLTLFSKKPSELQPILPAYKPPSFPHKETLLNSKNKGNLPNEVLERNMNSEVIEVNSKVYNLLSFIGSGGSCKVYSAFDSERKSLVAIKCVNLKGTDTAIREGYKQEIEYLQKLQNSDRVIKMYDFEYHEHSLFLVLEHGEIDFAKYISNEAKLKRLSPLMIKFYWAQMLQAVADIHKYGIVHSDLKPANFLLVAGNLKLIDFGIAASVPDDKTSTFRETQVGTINYMSPEAITQLSTSDGKQPRFKVGVKSDIWSLGCILYNLVYGVNPFSTIKSLMQKIYAITNPSYEIQFKPLPDALLLDVLKSCLKRNPKERASVEELLGHPYLTEDSTSSVNVVSTKPNENFKDIVKQMEILTPRRMRYITKMVKELSEKSST